MKYLQDTLREEFGKRSIADVEMPKYFATSLNPMMKLRPYQEECFKYFITYFDKIKYEETADPRIHFRNTVKERHKKYLNIIKFPSLRQLLNNNDCVSGRSFHLKVLQ